jgi:hypothetical protein
MNALHHHARVFGLFVGALVVSSCKESESARPPASLRFESAPPAARGGLIDFAVANLDKENPFNGPAPILVSGAIAVRYTEVSPSRVTGTALVDPTAPIGPLQLEIIATNPRGDLLRYSSAPDDPKAPLIALARAPLRLTPGNTAPDESISAPRHTNIYAVNVPEDDDVFVLTFATVGASLRTISGSRLVGAMAPASGKFGEGVTFDTTFDSIAGSRVAVGLARKAGESYFAIHTSDFSGGPSEYNYSVRPAFAKGTKFSMKESDKPPELTGAPSFAIDGAIDYPGDSDFVLFSSEKGGRVVVQATPIGIGGPLNVSIYGTEAGTGDCTAFQAGGIGTGQVEAKTVPMARYCARINSTTPLKMQYQLVITPVL